MAKIESPVLPSDGRPAAQASPSLKAHLSHDELYAAGKSLREKCPRSSHASWKAPADRRDPIELLKSSSEGRIPHLVPIRYGRMMQSPFAFYRGTALNMAADLASTPNSGLRVQACGDCHLSNFGAFATPERRVIFDINDMDETLPAPWEWDVKRLAASFVLASRHNGFSAADARDAAQASARAYREHMGTFSRMRVLDVWYASVDVESLIAGVKDKQAQKRMQKRLAKARERSVLEHDFPELVTTEGTVPVIRDNLPLIYHASEQEHAGFTQLLMSSFAAYRETLPEHRRTLLDRYEVTDFAIKVVGVGSVGTFCAIMLLMAAESDPLFLQVKQAKASVLEPYAGKSAHANHGQRIVHGCHLIQSASDVFLGWTEGPQGRHFYIRQLKDMKVKPLVEVFTPGVMLEYAELCGWTLARAHARSGEPAMIAGYLGKGDTFDLAVADFSMAYADQAERDHQMLTRAVREGTLEAHIEED